MVVHESVQVPKMNQDGYRQQTTIGKLGCVPSITKSDEGLCKPKHICTSMIAMYM